MPSFLDFMIEESSFNSISFVLLNGNFSCYHIDPSLKLIGGAGHEDDISSQNQGLIEERYIPFIFMHLVHKTDNF